jgi:microsomal dipeptidase-like Zn-dependent dipeptidase
MMVDASHGIPPARSRVYDIVGKSAAILAFHVGAHEINPDPYNSKDWEMKQVADRGLIGVIFMNCWSMLPECHRGLNFSIHTMDHIVNVVGLDYVGIGSDSDGFTNPSDDLKGALQLPRLRQRLLVEGYSPVYIQKISGGNTWRVLIDG